MSLIRHKRQAAGFTMIEVLVAILILSVGLLGLSAMQLTSLKVNQGAYHRSQASLLASDILDRMRSNREAFLDGDYDSFETDGAIPAEQTACTSTGGCADSAIANQDKREWAANFEDVYGLGDNFVPLIPNAVGSIERDASNNATVTIQWTAEGWAEDDGEVTKDSVTETFSVVVRI